MNSIIVNELSLDGQFNSIEDFEKELRESFKIFNLKNKLDKKLYFSSSIYNQNIDSNINVSKYLLSSRSDEARKFRSYLVQNSCWDMDSNKQYKDGQYLFNFRDVSNYSIAEAFERQCSLYSFNHPAYTAPDLQVCKNKEIRTIKNYTNIKDYIDTNFEMIVNTLWTELNSNFEINFRLLLKIFAINKDFSFNCDYKVSEQFKEQLTNIPIKIRNKSIEQIVKRLSCSRDQASMSTSLNDEPIRGTSHNVNIRRFYITKNLGRIHYEQKESCIYFKELNTQHDRGLT